jgi:predicted porin
MHFINDIINYKGVIMKKQLLVATALATTLGVAGAVDAASATFSGHLRNGVEGEDKDSSSDETYAAKQQASFAVAVSETTDSGIKISGSFDLSNESDGSTDPSGLTLTFTDGSKLDLIEAGSAYGTHLASVPGATGEQGVSGGTSNNAPSGLTYASANDSVGFEWHSAADFAGVEGLKAGVSAGFGDDGDATTTSTAENSYSVGLSYVTTAGDTTITIGGGYMAADDSNASTQNDKANSSAVALSAVTGNLTVGAGFAGGDFVASDAANTASTAGSAAMEIDDVSVTTIGAKYVSGDITFAIGMADGDADDKAVNTTTDSANDAHESTNASVSYTVAPGVSAIVGYKDSTSTDEGQNQTANSGSAWYLGALISF